MNFTITAVIDWIELNITTERNTNQQTIQRILHDALTLEDDANVWVKPLDQGAGGAATSFTIRFQSHNFGKGQISYAKLTQALTRVENKVGFASRPAVSAIEIALDFYRNQDDAPSLEECLRVLAGKLHTRGSNPRLFASTGSRSLQTRGMRITGDKTYYAGDKKDPVCWKGYVKRQDQARKHEDVQVAVSLPLSEHRTRLEVTLQGEAPDVFGFASLSELEHYRFEKLASLFHFRCEKSVGVMAGSDPFMTMIVNEVRDRADATEDRGQHSYEEIGAQDKWGRTRKHSRHTFADRELNKKVRDRLRRLSERFAKNDDRK